MKIPAKNFKIKVSPYNIDVVYKEECEVSKGSYKLVYGTWNFTKLEICLSSKYNVRPDQLQNTFIHELIHCFFDVSGLSSVSKKMISEEIAAERLSHCFQSFIQDNPKLFKQS